MKRVFPTLTIVAAALQLLCLSAVAQGLRMSPSHPIEQYESLNGRTNIQKFSGAFVRNLAAVVVAHQAQQCLQSLDGRAVSVTLEDGGHIGFASGASCTAAISTMDTNANAVDHTSISATRILALALAVSRFNTDPFFRTNDRDLIGYDVEMYDKTGLLFIFFAPLHPEQGVVVMGCDHTGQAYATYVVSPQTLTIRLGHIVC